MRRAHAGVDAERLYRVLRAAVQLGIFAVSVPPRGASAEPHLRSVQFRNNRLSAVLREDHPNCIKDIVRLLGQAPHLPACRPRAAF